MPVSDGRKEPTATLLARVSPDDVVLFLNEALAEYVGATKSELTGVTLDELRALMRGEMAEFFARESKFSLPHQLVVDPSGRVFEASRLVRGALLDLLATEVPSAGDMMDYFHASTPLSSADLSPEEIRSVLQPERRLVSLSRTRLCGLEEFSATASPGEVRMLLMIFAEEMRESIWSVGSSVGAVSPGEVEGIYGMPRYFQDHALRALRSVFAQFQRLGKLRSRLHRLGHDVPLLSAGISGGEVLLTPLPDPSGHRLAATGPAARLAELLADMAPPGEIYISQFALSSLLAQLPEGWGFLRAQIDESAGEVAHLPQESFVEPLPETLRSHVYLVGPDVENHPERSAFYFSYLFTVSLPGFTAPLPVLRAVQPEDSSGAVGGIELSEDRIVSAPAVMVLGKYKLMEVIGQGGMGKVWRGQDQFGNPVAIKVLNSAETASEDSVRRFQREAEIMARLPHRNICRVFEISQAEEVQFIVMEFIEGITLADLLYENLEDDPPGGWRDTPLPELIRTLLQARQRQLQEGRQPIAETGSRPDVNRILPFGQTLSLFAKICEGVQFAHEQGILHRDLKPGNVLLRVDGEPLVADFGLAKLEEETEQSLSVSGHVVGTIENMSPEQAESSKDVDERADVYSLATILYQMLTGHRHFEASGNIFSDAASLKHHQPIRPRQWNPRIEPDLEMVLLKALRPNPLQRYRTVSAFQADLNRYRRGESVKARPVSVLELGRKVVQKHAPMAAVIFLALLALTFTGVFGFLHLNERRLELEDALQQAGEQARIAEMALVEAQQLRERAEHRQREAETALTEARAARRAAEAAEQEKDQARLETAEHLEARTRYEETARSLQERLNELEQPSAAAETIPAEEDFFVRAESDSALESSPLDEPFLAAGEKALTLARTIFYDQLSPFRLRLEPSTQDLRESLLEGLNAATTALAIAPQLTEAWFYKGHFHFALGEREEASESWSQGYQLVENSRDREAEWGLSLQEFAVQFPPGGQRIQRSRSLLAAELKEMKSRDGLVLAELLTRPSFAARARNLEPGEKLLQLRALNPEFDGQLSWIISAEGGALFVVGASGITDWSPLQRLPVRELRITEARSFDWRLLSDWSLAQLHLNVCEIPEWPAPGDRRLAGLTVADFTATPLPNGISFLSAATQLQTLNLGGTGITDIGPIQGRYLRHLDLSGTEVENILHLSRYPLVSLVLDPSLAANNSKIHFLRFHRSLNFLRTENDPINQTLGEFWRNVTSGLYAPEGSLEPGASEEDEAGEP
jgi:serine/threonine protein kinase